ncbi:MAG: hypothetical protein ACSHWN_05430 [Methylophilaceae bacterium]
MTIYNLQKSELSYIQNYKYQSYIDTVVPDVSELLKKEKDYQHILNEKLKSAADWDLKFSYFLNN